MSGNALVGTGSGVGATDDGRSNVGGAAARGPDSANLSAAGTTSQNNASMNPSGTGTGAGAGNRNPETGGAGGSGTTSRTYTDKYTDGTAAIYEEWNVIKKNKFGIKQERMFGIDINNIYNSKRSDTGRTDRHNVRLAQRDIADIVKFEKVDSNSNESKTFRITWQEENIQYAIDYTCDSERDCNQIINKLQYIRRFRGLN